MNTNLTHLETPAMPRLLTHRIPLLVVAILASIAGARDAGAVDLTGCWEGSWSSQCTRHQGPLYATFERCDATRYRVHFRGRFFKIFPFRYTVVLQVVEETSDHVTLSGSQNLGRLFGTFTYSATATDCEFTSRYASSDDQGIFRLRKISGR